MLRRGRWVIRDTADPLLEVHVGPRETRLDVLLKAVQVPDDGDSKVSFEELSHRRWGVDSLPSGCRDFVTKVPKLPTQLVDRRFEGRIKRRHHFLRRNLRA